MEIKQKMNEKKSTNERGRCKRKILTTQNWIEIWYSKLYRI
jgi:hypothetical protein